MKLLFHQIWNQRRQNCWIFIELLLVSAFLWVCIDPLYVIVANRLIPKGYDSDRRCFVKLDVKENAPEGMDDDAVSDMFRRTMTELKDLPEVEDFCIFDNSGVISGSTWNGNQLFKDTTDIGENDEKSKFTHVQTLEFTTDYGGDLCRFYGLTDATTGKPFLLPKNAGGKIVLTENAARRLFGRTDIIGKSVYYGNKEPHEICGVVQDIKYTEFQQPYPTQIQIEPTLSKGGKHLAWKYSFGLKLKKDVDERAFMKWFEKEVKPKLESAMFYCYDISSMERNIERRAANTGAPNKINLQMLLIIFALTSIFLGMLGTFWMRTNARRAEIGLMRSMGATKGSVIRRTLTEAAILVTLAFITALPALLLYTRYAGLYIIDENLIELGILNMDYPQNRFASHFITVTLLAYTTLLGISLLGTLIPAVTASRTQPAEVLKDEQ